MELTRALTTIENARMEWNSARLRFPLLAGGKPDGDEAAGRKPRPRRGLRSAARVSASGAKSAWR